MSNNLKHVTFSIREDHIELLNDLSNRYALRSRSAALAFMIEEYKRLDQKYKIVTGGSYNG